MFLGDSLDFSFIYVLEYYDGLECRFDYDFVEVYFYEFDRLGVMDFKGNMIGVFGKLDIFVNVNMINGGVFSSLIMYCFILDLDWWDNEFFYVGINLLFIFNGFI